MIRKVDISKLNAELVEILMHCYPNAEEADALKAHAEEVHKLAEGDQFMLSMTAVEHGDIKLKVMLFMHTFQDSSSSLRPQIDSILAASSAITSSTRLKKVFEMILGLWFFRAFFPPKSGFF